MLVNSNHKNSNCGFSEELVSYLYGECSAEEKKTVEKHLNSCVDCMEEFAGFSSARSLVAEWRDEEFLPLDIPLFVLPNSKEPNFNRSKALKNISRSWLAEIQNRLTLSPAAYAFGAIAIFVACLGLIFLPHKNYQNNELAEVAIKNTEPDKASQDFNNPSDLNVAKPNLPQSNSAENFIPVQQRTVNSAITPKTSRSETFSRANLTVKNTVGSNLDKVDLKVKLSNQKTDAAKINLNNIDNKKPMFAQNNKLPRLNTIEDDEDKSLRLAELLEDDGESK